MQNAKLLGFAFLLFQDFGNGLAVPLSCVGIELSSRAVSRKVFSPLQSLTSVFGMGTGGPSAFITPTQLFGAFAPEASSQELLILEN